MSKSKLSRRFSRMTSPPAIFPRDLDRGGKDSHQSAMMTAKGEVSVIAQDLPDCLSGIVRRRSIHARLMLGASPPQCYPKIWSQAIHTSDSSGSADALEEVPEGAQEGRPQKRAASMERFQELHAQHCRRETRLVYASKAHFHRDMALGYTWAAKNKKAWRVCDSAPLFDRMSRDGASWHRAKSVQAAAAEVDFTLIPLPF